ncbi:MAG: DUF4124 domain-containing protein [Lysobacteraceae bacterium]|uniref:DUF4124 domain-containing protein n=1 Tax=Denitratimonas sp. CY0512 TaxID=3131940 RepID=UPI0030B46667
MRYLPILPLALMLLASGSVALASEVYRWTDERGVVHYSDTPPDSSKFERVNVRTGATRSDPEPEPEVTAETTASIAQVSAEDAATRARHCDTARRNLIALNSSLDVTGEFEGESRLLTAEERQDQIDRNQRLVDRYCDTP